MREDAVDRVRDAVLRVRVGLPAAQRLDLARCVAHGDGERDRAQHFEIVFAVSDGGGVVEITMTGDKILKSITLKPEVVDPEDIETLQDLIVSGVNEVLRKVEEETEGRMNEISGGLNIPGLY